MNVVYVFLLFLMGSAIFYGLLFLIAFLVDYFDKKRK